MVTLAGLVAGCAARPPTPATIDLEARRAYTSLTESLAIDAAPLAGRVVVIDPGHGGDYRGTIGRGGLAEADVNLAVALFLWGMLEEAGAQPVLTRTVDRDFVDGTWVPPVPARDGAARRRPVTPPDSLGGDLAARMRLANRVGADLFLSIHHNADASGDTTRDQTQTFYRMGDSGPSLDAAQAIHRHLMLNLGTASGRVLPGNYHVLRSSTAPAAVLGEASYLTNPLFEDNLLRIDRVELEAAAYFLGLLDYFRGGLATVAGLAPSDTTVSGERLTVEVHFAGAPVDPASVAVRLDGQRLAAVTTTSGTDPRYRVPVAPPPLAAGLHRLRVEARCLGGNAVPAREALFEVRRPVAALHLAADPDRGAYDAAGPRALEVLATDRLGLPVGAGETVELVAPIAGRATTRGDGRAWFYVGPATDPPAGVAADAGTGWHVRAGAIEARLEQVAGHLPACSGFVVADDAAPLSGAAVRTPTGELVRANPDGYFAIVPAADGGVTGDVIIEAPGYLPASWMSRVDGGVRRWRQRGAIDSGWRDRPLLRPRLGGVLAGRRITVDAGGGGAEGLPLGSSGLRGATLTLSLARRVAELLEAAGARVLMVREDERTLPAMARIEVSERAGAERYLRLMLGDGPDQVLHYPGSQHGQALASALANALAAEGTATQGTTAAAEEGTATPAVRARITPILLHTSCPAVEILWRGAALDPAVARLGSASGQRRLARAIVMALASTYGYDVAGGATLSLDTAEPLLVDGLLVIEPEAGGVVTLDGLEPQPAVHRIEALGAGAPVVQVALPAGEVRALRWPPATTGP
jgi:N-acetylmuramoyl-L-alanine amidase